MHRLVTSVRRRSVLGNFGIIIWIAMEAISRISVRIEACIAEIMRMHLETSLDRPVRAMPRFDA